MKASRYDTVIDCPACGAGGCQLCSEDGQFAYYAPANPGEIDREVLIYSLDRDDDGSAKKHMMSAQRFNTLAGDGTQEPPTDDNGNITIAQDIADRYQNQLGKNAPYTINGNEITESDFPNGFPSDPDMTPQEVITWLRARGDETLANRLQTTVSTLGL